MKRIYYFLRAFIIPLCFISLHYGNNASKVAFRDILVSLLFVLILSCLIFGILKAITKSLEKAILLSYIFFFLFFNYDNFAGVMFNSLITNQGISSTLLDHQKTRFLCAILLAIMFGILAYLLSTKKNAEESYQKFNNIFSIGMIIIVLGSLGFRSFLNSSRSSELSSDSIFPQWQQTLASEDNLIHPADQLPDIYYIILDGYGRKDVLKEYYDFDNASFLDSLANLGFGISPDSLANYKQTDLSFSSLLNMDYINWVGDQVGGQNSSYFPLYYLIDHNRVFNQLHRAGYRIDTFATGFTATEIDTANMIFRPKFYPNNYENLLIKATPLSLFWDSWLNDLHRDRIRYGLQNLAKAGNQDGPDFVFLHVFAPHPPFVFGPNGEDIDPDHPYSTFDAAEFLEFGTAEEYKTGYIDQVTYVNKEILAAIQEILQTSSVPPIIIIQGDHGPGLEFDHQNLEKSNLAERYPILYAYFIPCGKNNPILQDITPVNSFRYIFNACFNGNLPYLENRQYFSSNLTPYKLVDVTDLLREELETEKKE